MFQPTIECQPCDYCKAVSSSELVFTDESWSRIIPAWFTMKTMSTDSIPLWGSTVMHIAPTLASLKWSGTSIASFSPWIEELIHKRTLLTAGYFQDLLQKYAACNHGSLERVLNQSWCYRYLLTTVKLTRNIRMDRRPPQKAYVRIASMATQYKSGIRVNIWDLTFRNEHPYKERPYRDVQRQMELMTNMCDAKPTCVCCN